MAAGLDRTAFGHHTKAETTCGIRQPRRHEPPGASHPPGHGAGDLLDVSAAQLHETGERCFKCPKQRRQGDLGWHFVDLEHQKRLLGPNRLYVCPQDYLRFAVSERVRWMALVDGAEQPRTRNGDAENGGPAIDGDAGIDGDPAVHGDRACADAPASPCSADELLGVLAHRGLAGWAFLVRDVAAGRVRRVHLRQLPADPAIRRSLIAYLQSTGATVTLSRTVREQQRRVSGG